MILQKKKKKKEAEFILFHFAWMDFLKIYKQIMYVAFV